MKISACYIVKNEASTLTVSLTSLAQYVDEIIVIDTDSTDETVKIAKEYGAAVFHFPWQNDFSMARNFALSKATGDWLICLDADETVTFGRNKKGFKGSPHTGKVLVRKIGIPEIIYERLINETK
jgi:glycosyltransferase involved in cell wall biosynthesis